MKISRLAYRGNCVTYLLGRLVPRRTLRSNVGIGTMLCIKFAVPILPAALEWGIVLRFSI